MNLLADYCSIVVVECSLNGYKVAFNCNESFLEKFIDFVKASTGSYKQSDKKVDGIGYCF